LVTDTARADAPIGLFSGDFLFVGDIGRPDLLEAAVGQAGTKEIGARQQFQNIQRARQWPDFLQIWPGHGAGSACGKALGAIPSTTLGYEKRFSPAFSFGDDENAFVDWLLNGQPDPPKYFAQMKRVNKAGPVQLAKLTPPQKLNREQLLAALSDAAQVFDLRERAEFSRAHLQGSIGIPASSKSFTTYVGWLVNFNQPIYLIVPNLAEIESISKALRAIGIDNVAGYGGPEVILETDSVLPTINTQQLVQRMKEMDLMVLDVRNQSEFDELHIANAAHIPLGVLSDRLAQIPHDRAVVVQCASGYRSHIATSLLQRFGFDNISSLTDGIDQWSKALMVETKQ
jgi:hydroxyacylglutathione hydrolase